MPEEKNNQGRPADENKKSGKTKNPSFFKKLADAFLGKLGEFKGEFKKIVWPSRETLLKETLTVIVICVIFGVYIALLDGGLSFALSAFSGFAQNFGG
ncbi:MAG: preprotein translocase subunit SecE [Clostridiales bacterium]|jgi:preprotein translocase subunit SecE|nr:preprotein translocase subunit SecE [Clostridiales bacterium]